MSKTNWTKIGAITAILGVIAVFIVGWTQLQPLWAWLQAQWNWLQSNVGTPLIWFIIIFSLIIIFLFFLLWRNNARVKTLEKQVNETPTDVLVEALDKRVEKQNIELGRLSEDNKKLNELLERVYTLTDRSMTSMKEGRAELEKLSEEMSEGAIANEKTLENIGELKKEITDMMKEFSCPYCFSPLTTLSESYINF